MLAGAVGQPCPKEMTGLDQRQSFTPFPIKVWYRRKLLDHARKHGTPLEALALEWAERAVLRPLEDELSGRWLIAEPGYRSLSLHRFAGLPLQ